MASSKNWEASLIRRSLRTGESAWFSSARVDLSACPMAVVTRTCAGFAVSGSTRLPEHASATVAKEKVRSDRFSPSNERTSAMSAAFCAAVGGSSGSLPKEKQALKTKMRMSCFIGLIEIPADRLEPPVLMPDGSIRLEQCFHRRLCEGVGFDQMGE